jgi:CBS domain-containing protein
MDTRVEYVLDRKGRDVHHIDPDSTVYEAIDEMDRRNIGALVVMRDHRLEGMITERDYMKKIALLGRSSTSTRVEDVMTREVVVVDPDYTVRECLTVMSEAHCRHLPVIEGESVGGLISIGDCVRQITLDQEAEIQFLKDYIAGRYPG